MITEERRSEPRYRAAYRIAYEYFVHGTKIGEGSASTVNISERGALVEIPQAVDINGRLILWIMAPLYTLLVQGNVVHARRGSNGMFQVGVQLTDIMEGDWELLQQYTQIHQNEFMA